VVEHSHKERHLLRGLLLQVAVVVALVFAYTQAVRQLKVQHERLLRLEEQLVVGRTRVGEKPDEEFAHLKEELTRLTALLSSREELEGWANELRRMAKEEFGFPDPEVAVGMVERKIEIPIEPLPSFKLELYAVELKGKTTTRLAAGLLAAVDRGRTKRLCPLETLELKSISPAAAQTVEARLKWLVAVSDRSVRLPRPSAPAPEPAAAPLPWGGREEPFQSPFLFSGAVRPAPGRSPSFQLTGILWDPATPTAVVNGILLKPGDRIQGWRLVLLTSDAVLLARGGEEVFLSLS
jgi:hypothetical protein